MRGSSTVAMGGGTDLTSFRTYPSPKWRRPGTLAAPGGPSAPMNPRNGTRHVLSALVATLLSGAACSEVRPPVKPVTAKTPFLAPSARGDTSGGSDGGLPLASGDSNACKAPMALLSRPSAFHAALVRWSEEPVGSTGANTALEAACDGATEGSRATERSACVLLGLAYASGDGVKRDPVKAFELFARGATCELNFGAFDLAQAREHAITQSSVSCCAGRSCRQGCEATCTRAIEQVRSELEPPLRAACDRGRGVACHMLAALVAGQYIQEVGPLTLKGTDEERDLSPLLEKACRSGVGPACEQLAWRTTTFSETQTAASKRAELAKQRTLLQRACEAGWGDGCFHLGKSYEETGEHPRAVLVWEKACSLGLHRVCDELEDMHAKAKAPRRNTR